MSTRSASQPQPQPQAPDPSLRVMTFNIRGAHNDDGPNRWPERADLNVRTILCHAPDLIGFQELDPGNLDVYRERLPGYRHVLGPPYNNTPDEYQYPTIFWNPRRLDLLASGGFWLSLTPEQHSGAWGTDCVRAATWVRLAWLEAGLTFVHLNTHLDHISELARVEGTKLILHRLAPMLAEGLPVIVTADFNCMPDSAAHQLFIDAGFTDTYTAAGHTDTRYTYHGFRGLAFEPWPSGADRMDWVLVHAGQRRLEVLSAEIVDDAEPPVHPSDHYPVLAEFRLR